VRTGAERSYKNGPKNHWRRTVWNEVLRRTAGREKTQPILYLAGPEDLDRAVAVSKGVPRQNLIAVDRHMPNVKGIQGAGAPAVCESIESVLWSWPDGRPVAAVMLDFCGGLHVKHFADVMQALQRSPYRHSVIMLNLLRGRDPSTAKHREQAVGAQHILEALGMMPHGEPKHRGRQFIAALLMMLSGTVFLPTGVKFEGDVLDQAGQTLQALNPFFGAYRSGPQVFDSVIFNGPWRLSDALIDRETEELWCDKHTRRRIAAMLAVRTMRQTGKLPRKAS
jgi:hypothetical protein